MTTIWKTALTKVENIKYLNYLKTFRRVLPDYWHAAPLQNIVSAQQLKTKEKLNTNFINLKKFYEEFTGIDQVVAAQRRVVEAEEKFIKSQDQRRLANNRVTQVQQRLRDIHAELDCTKRGEEKFVYLLTEELKLLKEEKILADEFQKYEREERERFSTLSSALKESHEKERMQSEKTKYWSIIGSILGTILGVVGSSINNQFRMREFRSILQDAVTNRDGTSIELTLSKLLSKLDERTIDVTATQILSTPDLPPVSPPYVSDQQMYTIVSIVGIILCAFYLMR